MRWTNESVGKVKGGCARSVAAQRVQAGAATKNVKLRCESKSVKSLNELDRSCPARASATV